VANTSVRGLYYVLIYVSYNEIIFLLYLCKQHLYLSYERLHIAGLDDCGIIQPRHLVRNRQAMSRATKEHLAWRDLRET
jgi:hypothetical protein